MQGQVPQVSAAILSIEDLGDTACVAGVMRGKSARLSVAVPATLRRAACAATRRRDPSESGRAAARVVGMEHGARVGIRGGEVVMW
jgi:hypothetical protein